jgi:hypothetical protein
MQGLWRPRPKIDEAEFDAAKSRTAARLAEVFGLEPPVPATDLGTTPDAEQAIEAASGPAGQHDEPETSLPSQAANGPRPGIVVEGGSNLVGVMAEPGPDLVGVTVHADMIDEAAVEPTSVAGGATDTPGVTARPARRPGTPVGVMEPRRLDSAAKGARGEARTAGARAVRPGARPARGKTRAAPVAIAPSCPYCAVLLQPAPTTSRRCLRCRHRIVVKRVAGRAVYLTEAAVEVFEAERKRSASAGRLARERARWLTLAAAAGAPPERSSRLLAAAVSEELVDSARALYLATVERSFQVARRERRWEDASRIRREHAAVLYRMAKSPVPPPAEIVKLHRDGVTAELRGIAAIARDAELVAATCCDTCRAEDGRVLRVSAELRAPRLPHDGCPKGLCRCRWALATPRTTVQRYLRRRPRAERQAGTESFVTTA